MKHIAEAVISRALDGYTGCMCDECLIPHLYAALLPYIEQEAAAWPGDLT